MNQLLLAVALGMIPFLLGCRPNKFEFQCQTVKIVAVTYADETGSPDWKTVVEFPDGTRRWAYHNMGQVGDEFCARKVEKRMWR